MPDVTVQDVSLVARPNRAHNMHTKERDPRHTKAKGAPSDAIAVPIGAIADQIVAVLQDGPKTWKQIEAALPPQTFSASTARMVVGQLQHSGRVIRIGANIYGDLYRLRTPEEAGALAKVRNITPPTSAIDPAVLTGEITRVLKSGASYDVAELVRNVRGRFPQIDQPTMQRQLEQLAGAGLIERFPLGSNIRYRKRAHVEAVS